MIVDLVQSEKISELRSSSNIACLLLYGSVIKKSPEDINDTDIILVVHDITEGIEEIFCYIRRNFKNPDIHIYALSEIDSNLAYLGREFILEYLAKGTVLFGENVFKNKYAEVNQMQYRVSMLVRSAEYLQRIRKLYFSQNIDEDEALVYVKKYIVRLSKCVLILKGILSHSELDSIQADVVLSIMHKNRLLDRDITHDTITELSQAFHIFNQIGLLLQHIAIEDTE